MIYNIGDLHIKKNNESINWEANAIALLEYFKSVSFTKEDVLVFTGDVSDTSKNSGHINKLILQIFQYLSSQVNHIYVIPGNHETSLSNGTALRLLLVIENLTLFETFGHAIIDDKLMLFAPSIEGLTFNGRYEEKMNKYCEDNSLTDVFCIYGHAATNFSKMFNMSYLDIELLSFNFQYMIMGDIHKADKWVTGNRVIISTGSFWPDDKGERNYDFSYSVFEGNIFKTVPIPKGLFYGFENVNYKDLVAFAFKPKTFYCVSVLCKKEEKSTIEKEIKKVINRNLYDITYSYIDDVKEEMSILKTDNDVLNFYFKENPCSKNVQNIIFSKLQRN